MNENDKMLDNSLESTINMSEDEIERLLLQNTDNLSNDAQDLEDADLATLLAGLDVGDDDNLQEISELLNKADNNEAVDKDIMSLMKSQEEMGQTAYDAMDLFSGEVTEKKEGLLDKIKKLFTKKKTDEIETEEFKREKKKSRKKTKEDKKKKSEKQTDTPEMVLDNGKEDSMNDALALLTGGNVDDSQALEKKKDEKIKKKKVKAQPEADEEQEVKEKSKKKKEKKKNKKENNKKETDEIRDKVKEKPTIADAIMELEEEQEEPPNKKKIIMVFAASILILLGFLVVNHYFTRYSNKKLAEEAYENNNYLECYQLLYGQKLNDSQAAMFYRSELKLKTEIFWKNYNGFIKEKKWLEGLDELTQYIYQYPQLLEYASTWNCFDIVVDTYERVKQILIEDYFTSEEEIVSIAQLESDVDYTKALLRLLDEKQKKDDINMKYPDMLPEEEEKIIKK